MSAFGTKLASSLSWHLGVLGASCGIILLSLLLQVRPDQRIVFRALPQYPIPQTCALRRWLDVDCPSCGLTRSFIHLAHGDCRASLRVHRLGWLLAGVVVFQVPYRLRLLGGRRRPLLSVRASLVLAYGLIAVLLANWLCQLTVW